MNNENGFQVNLVILNSCQTGAIESDINWHHEDFAEFMLWHFANACLETQLKGGIEHSPQNIQGTLWLAQLYLVDRIAQIQ